MAKKESGMLRELKRIEAEEKAIEKEEKKIEDEEGRIEQKEDLLRVFEELGLMRWKSYYILTAGAILLLSLTFVASLWVMHDQISVIDSKLDTLPAQQVAQKDWCPTGATTIMDMGTGSSTISILGKEMKDGKEMCHAQTTITTEQGTQTADIWYDQTGAYLTSP
jgi:hypothetical protein